MANRERMIVRTSPIWSLLVARNRVICLARDVERLNAESLGLIFGLGSDAVKKVLSQRSRWFPELDQRKPTTTGIAESSDPATIPTGDPS